MQKLKDDGKPWREARLVREYIEAVRESAESKGAAVDERWGVGEGGGNRSQTGGKAVIQSTLAGIK